MDVETVYLEVKALHQKIDRYHEATVKNTTDIAWLKRGIIGVFSSIFIYAGSFIYRIGN